MDPIGRVVGAPRVVISQRQPLDVAEETGSKAQDEPLAGVRAQHRRAELLELTENGDEHDQGSDQNQQPRAGALRGCPEQAASR